MWIYAGHLGDYYAQAKKKKTLRCAVCGDTDILVGQALGLPMARRLLRAHALEWGKDPDAAERAAYQLFPPITRTRW